MAHVSRRLNSSFEGALAGGGDPATSPLYVFGPFLKLIVIAGVAKITFGASVWLVVLTVALVSAMYRLVMNWVTDGSGGSGLSEEEFGGWAVKVNASITFVEYTLTFLVSIAALVTFLADRFPALNQPVLGLQYRTFVAVFLSIVTGWLVNRGPKVAARAFGPATAGVLILLWAMVIATLWKTGLELPAISWQAFNPDYLDFTLGGYARILAVMTGIEVFANLVAAYDGSPQKKSKMAFRSLLIIMGTTSITMLVVGPAILQLSDPTDQHISVFTQTMDQLLPYPLPLLGTIVGVAVLLSAAAASAQGLQNLALGLKLRHYVPASIGQRNAFEVADKPVWIQVILVSLCFLAFGTSEETYLAIYAAGVFILLSMTGWAAAKRLFRYARTDSSWRSLVALAGTVIAAALTTGATFIIFDERFTEGAWTYFLFLPLLYVIFSYFRRRLGEPSSLEDRLGLLYTQSKHLPYYERDSWRQQQVDFKHIMVALDGSEFAERALPLAEVLSCASEARMTLMSVNHVQSRRRLMPDPQAGHRHHEGLTDHEIYLSKIGSRLEASGIRVESVISSGKVADEIASKAQDSRTDLLVMSTHGRSGVGRLLLGSVANKVVQLSTIPVLLVRPHNARPSEKPVFRRVLVALDGSTVAERILPYVRALATQFDTRVLLLSVPEALESEDGRESIDEYLEGVVAALSSAEINVQAIVTGSDPALSIVNVAETEAADLIMLATHGRGGLDRFMTGSVADHVVKNTHRPVFLVPVRPQL